MPDMQVYATYTGQSWIYYATDGQFTTATYEHPGDARDAWKNGERIPMWQNNLGGGLALTAREAATASREAAPESK